MSLMHIRAQFQCDGCGRAFIVEMDPTDKMSADWTIFDNAVEYVRGGPILKYLESKKNEAPGMLASVQADQHLCPGCTYKVDAYMDDVVKQDRDATPEEIEKALQRRTFENAVNPEEGYEDE